MTFSANRPTTTLAILLGLLSLAVPAAANDLYVVDKDLDAIVKFDGATGDLRGTFGSAGGGSANPYGLACASNGNLLVTREGLNDVVEIDNATGALLGVFADTNMSTPEGLTIGPNGNLFVANNGKVVEFDGTTGAFVKNFAEGLPGPLFSLAFGPNGNLFVALGRGARELKGDTGEFVQDLLVPSGGARGLTFGPTGTLFVSFVGTNVVVEFDVISGVPIQTLGGLNAPHGITFGPNGNLFVSNPGTDQILEFDPVAGAFVPFATAGLSIPLELMFGTSSGPCALPPAAEPFSFTSPPSGSQFIPGAPVTVSWTGGAPHWDVSVLLVQASPSFVVITSVASVPNSQGTVQWTLPETLGCGAGYKYQFYVQNAGPTTWTYGPAFDLPCPDPFSFISPPPGSQFIPGQPVTISWTGGAPHWDVSVLLVQTSPGFVVITSVASVPNSQGTVQWTLPETLGCGAGYKYQFYVQNAGPTTWTYGPAFDLPCPDPFSFTSPPPGSRFIPRQPVTISWTGGAPHWDVSVKLIQAAPNFVVITGVASVPNSQGSVDWTLPETLACGAGYRYQFYVENAGPTTWAYGPPFDFPCADRVIFTKVADTETPAPGQAASFTDLSMPSLDGVNVTFTGESTALDGTRIQGVYSSQECLYGENTACETGLVARADTATPQANGIQLRQIVRSPYSVDASTDDGHFLVLFFNYLFFNYLDGSPE